VKSLIKIANFINKNVQYRRHVLDRGHEKAADVVGTAPGEPECPGRAAGAEFQAPVAYSTDVAGRRLDNGKPVPGHDRPGAHWRLHQRRGF